MSCIVAWGSCSLDVPTLVLVRKEPQVTVKAETPILEEQEIPSDIDYVVTVPGCLFILRGHPSARDGCCSRAE